MAVGSMVVAMLAAGPLAAQRPDTSLALTLGDAARLAARQAPAAGAARARADAAEARVTGARAELLPGVRLDATDGTHTLNSATFGFNFSIPGQPPLLDPNGQIIGPFRVADVRGAASLDLLNLGARRRVSSAEAGAHAESATADAAADAAAAGAAYAYVGLMRAQALVGARTADSVLAADLLTIARQQLEAGVSIALDVTRAEAQVAEARANLVSARRDLGLARITLDRRLGVPLASEIRASDRIDSVSAGAAPAADTLVAQALAARTDLKAVQAAGAAARSRLSAAQAENLPVVSVYGDEGYVGLNYEHLLRTYDYGVKVSVPLFDGFRRRAHTREDEAVLEEARVREADVREQAEAEVRTALLDLNSSRERVDAAREQLRLGETELSEARERFTTGVAGNTDVVLAAASLNRARTGLVDALAAYHTARVELALAQGAITRLP